MLGWTVIETMSLPTTLETAPPSTEVVERVAAREGVDSTDLGVPLFEVVDPEALDSVVESVAESGTDARVEFTYYGYDVTVTPDGSVRVSDGG